MPTPRGGIDATGIGNRVFAVGGEEQSGTFEEVEVYDAELASWATMPPLPTPRHGLGVATLDGELYAASGGPEPGATYSDVLEILSP